jgi:hypothetical protein
MPNNLNGSQKCLEAYRVDWPSLQSVAQITKDDLPSNNDVEAVFHKWIFIKDLVEV